MAKIIKHILIFVTGIAIWFFWWLIHPELLAYQEQYQMFQTTWSYFVEHLCVCGGISSYLGEFFTQFNLFPVVGAGFIALGMVIIMELFLHIPFRLRLSLGKTKIQFTLNNWVNVFVGIGFVLLQNWMMGDENLLPSYLVAVIIVVAFIWTVSNIKSWLARIVMIVVLGPVVYWMVVTTHYRIPHQVLSAPGFNEEKLEVFQYDMLVRNEKWDEIILKAEKKNPTHPLGIQALNLALAKKELLGDRMFTFHQIGTGGIFNAWKSNSVDCVISSEIAWHTGFINTAFRYSFDSQEAIPDKRKSARLMKRMAECCIVNGDYKAAKKYINKLSHTLFYKSWAKDAADYLGKENMIAQHPVWGEKILVRFKTDYLFNYPEINKMFVLLAIESNGRNKIAWDYFNAATLAKGDLQTFAGMSHYGSELFGETILPNHLQEAWALYWTSSHPTFEGCPVPINPSIQQRITKFASLFTQNQGKFNGFEKSFSDTYWVYFLKKQQSEAAKQQNVDATSSASAQY